MSIRDYQRDWLDRVYAEWNAGRQNVFGVLPTGAGKTFSFITAIREQAVPAVVVVHRMELLAQASLALNREKLPHCITAPRETVREIIRAHMTLHGRSFYDPGAANHVAGVHTLAARGAKLHWAPSIKLAIFDEAHHVTNGGGIWSKAAALFSNARGLLVSAHCYRADGLGLGRGADGLADSLVVGPSCRALINRGFLSDYRFAIPPTDVDLRDVSVGSSGDFSPVQLSAAVHAAKQLVGHVAQTYRRFADGKLGLTFAVDLESADELAAAYSALGVPAAVINGKMPIVERAELMRRFRERRLLQLVSVDVLGEGTDVPDVEVVSMARPTASWQIYSQQIGRALRVSVAPDLASRWDQFTDDERRAHIAAGAKPRALIIDHVGNVARFHMQRGLPCSPQSYSLARADKRGRKAPSDAIPLRTCLNEECFQPYPRTLIVCPHCGTPAPAPAGRSAPEQVDGDLVMLEPEALAALAGDIARVDGPARVPQHLEGPAAAACKRNHTARQTAQATLRDAMRLWGGWRVHVGQTEREAQREFFFRFSVDVMTAQTYGAKEAGELEQRIRAVLAENGVVACSI